LGGNCSGCSEPRLSSCDIHQCEARCCYDGVYLLDGEESFLTELVSRLPALQAHLPAQFVMDGQWEGESLGRKTSTRAHDYRSADFPAHFTRTRCVFADASGFCELEKLARSRGQHPWSYKPAACWLFPLQEEGGEPEPPVSRPEEDPYRTAKYPGYSTFVPCGRDDPEGRNWRETLAAEIAYLKQASTLPLLGTPGHTVDELLGSS
jgi:hypothetical protein